MCVTIVDRGRLNRREERYDVGVDGGKTWTVILLAMPNGRYAWRIDDPQHRRAGEGMYHANSTDALNEGAVPYILLQEGYTRDEQQAP